MTFEGSLQCHSTVRCRLRVDLRESESKRTMKRYANVVVEPAQAAVLPVLRTAEVVSSMTGTQSCEDFTTMSHIKVVNRR